MTSTLRSTRARGFTLIEVLATLVVISIVMPAVMKGLSLAIAASTQSRRSVEAAGLAEMKLQDLITSGEWESGSNSGDFGQDYPDYKWEAQTILRDTDLMEIELKVMWMARGRERSVGIATLIYSPDPNNTASGTGTGATGP